MIKIGPAGSDGLGHLKGLQKVVRMKLDCMEVAFTYGVRMRMDIAAQMGALARENGIILSVHAPYFVNLASDESEKVAASKKRILDACQRADAMGARNVVFHAGFYQGQTARRTYDLIRGAILDMQEHIVRKGWQLKLCPETTGKPSQFGSLAEILGLMDDTGCGITIDFSHLYARQQGTVDYPKLLRKLPRQFHAHFSGIEYGVKGEKKHVVTQAKDFEPLARQLVKRPLDITLINESPQPYKDAAMMKKMLRKYQRQ
ncbi:MAG: TIM barrel protein [Desulfobacterales bacterium]|nr:MAG: TIM barrel protein [Desulfobacterales bacterium]